MIGQSGCRVVHTDRMQMYLPALPEFGTREDTLLLRREYVVFPKLDMRDS